MPEADTRCDSSVLVDPSVSKKLFRKWRSPRFGVSNPEKMNNPVWEWLVRSGLNAYQANQVMGGPSSMTSGPCWCFDRFGQSTTGLPGGRVVMIAGEHEDHYDPDFYIYNDVVVKHPDGRIDIYGYPKEVLQPTDFHSATLADGRIIVIGSLGYPDERRYGDTSIMVLDVDKMSFSSVRSSGQMPGWIHKHEAVMSDDGGHIIVRQGIIDTGADFNLVENIDDWQLDLTVWKWSRLTDRKWPRWEVRRKDGGRLHLFEYQQELWHRQMPALSMVSDSLASFKRENKIPTLKEEIGHDPDLDLFASLYNPPLAFEPLEASVDDFNIKRIRIDGTIVRYVEEFGSIHVTVEGELPEHILSVLTEDLMKKLSILENVACKLIRI